MYPVRLLSHPDTRASVDDEQAHCTKLDPAMYPNASVAIRQGANDDRTEREEEHPCQAAEYSMCNHNFFIVGWKTTIGEGMRCCGMLEDQSSGFASGHTEKDKQEKWA